MNARRFTSSNSPSSVGEVLSASADLNQPERVSWWLWRKAVGKRIAARSIPERLQGSTLVVTVKSALWAQELSMHRPLIIERLRQQYPELRALRFRVGEVVLPERPAPKNVPRPARHLPEHLERRLSEMEDAELSAAIREAAQLSLGKSRG
jgi:hypothetical protein